MKLFSLSSRSHKALRSILPRNLSRNCLSQCTEIYLDDHHEINVYFDTDPKRHVRGILLTKQNKLNKLSTGEKRGKKDLLNCNYIPCLYVNIRNNSSGKWSFQDNSMSFHNKDVTPRHLWECLCFFYVLCNEMWFKNHIHDHKQHFFNARLDCGLR